MNPSYYVLKVINISIKIILRVLNVLFISLFSLYIFNKIIV